MIVTVSLVIVAEEEATVNDEAELVASPPTIAELVAKLYLGSIPMPLPELVVA